MLSDATATKYYCGSKGSDGQNDGRRRIRRRQRKKAIPRATTGYAQQLKIQSCMTKVNFYNILQMKDNITYWALKTQTPLGWGRFKFEN